MAIQLEVRATDLPKKAADLRAQAKRLERRVVTAAGRVVKSTLEPAIKAHTPEYLPSGYAPAFAGDVQVRTSVRFVHNPGVTANISAPTGGPRGREIAAIEAGRLKHPLFGNKSYWYVTRVKRGLSRDSLKSTRPAIVEGIDSELEKIVRELAT